MQTKQKQSKRNKMRYQLPGRRVDEYKRIRKKKITEIFFSQYFIITSVFDLSTSMWADRDRDRENSE